VGTGCERETKGEKGGKRERGREFDSFLTTILVDNLKARQLKRFLLLL
jgi:hypothetical protein